MVTIMNKRKALSVEEKGKVIREIENGKKKADVCQEFGLVNSTTQTIWKNRTKIFSAFQQNGSRIKRLRKPERSDVDEALPSGLSNREVTMYQ
jgi:transposase-like protein